MQRLHSTLIVTVHPGRSAAADFSQEICDAQKNPHNQQVGAEGQQWQRVQEAGVQPEVTQREQAAQILLDHALPCPNAAQSQQWKQEGVGKKVLRRGREKRKEKQKQRRGNKIGKELRTDEQINDDGKGTENN